MTNISKVNYLLNIIIIMDHFDDDFAILCNGTSAILSNRTCKCVDFYSFFLDLYIVIFSSGVFFLKSIVSCLFISILVNKFRKTHASSLLWKWINQIDKTHQKMLSKFDYKLWISCFIELASHLKEGQWASKMWKWMGSLKRKKIYTVKEHFLYVTGGEIVV